MKATTCGECGHSCRATTQNMTGFLWCEIAAASQQGCSKETVYLSPGRAACERSTPRTIPLPSLETNEDRYLSANELGAINRGDGFLPIPARAAFVPDEVFI